LRAGTYAVVGSANRASHGDSALVPAVVERRSRPAPPRHVDEQALALTFASLLEPVEVGPGGAGRDQPAAETAGGIAEYPEGIYVQAAALLGARRTAQAALLLRRLDTITARLADRPRWRQRNEFLWAVHAQLTADVPGVLEHCVAAARSAGDLPPSDC